MRIKLIVLVSAFAFHVRRLFCVTVAAGRAVLGAGAAEESFELKDGDRVLFIGDTFFEREVDYGHIENNIAKRTVGTLSLMPSGVAENLTEAEQLDLFAFLSRLGKPGEFDARKGGVARRWRIYVVDHEDVQLARENRVWTEPLDGKIWIPLLSLVNGRLPVTVLSETTKGPV